MPEEKSIVIHSEAMYGAKTKQALVKLTVQDTVVVIPSRDAIKLALDILDTAHAADGDAFMVEWLRDKLKVEENQIWQILGEFRNHRIRKNGEQ